ncbi:hypothetical protein [Bradyrhizobium paxllaeri]|uniref:hypothetical protein n=1 Tax=Bradyrhizobium paxllaeri TaxID=190148 RepID=UPI001651EFA3|nr:hypothetical protein [Bradyrhizobium paxllaeri]
MNQISQSTEFKALRNPPNALSRQDSVLLAAFRRSETAVRWMAMVFGFDLGRTTAVTFLDLESFDLESCRWWTITLGGCEEPTLVSSDGELRSSTSAGCAGGSLLAAAISSRSAFANAACESEMPTAVSAGGSTTTAALRTGVLSSIAVKIPTPNGMRRPTNTILSMTLLHLFSGGENSFSGGENSPV